MKRIAIIGAALAALALSGCASTGNLLTDFENGAGIVGAVLKQAPADIASACQSLDSYAATVAQAKADAAALKVSSKVISKAEGAYNALVKVCGNPATDATAALNAANVALGAVQAAVAAAK